MKKNNPGESPRLQDDEKGQDLIEYTLLIAFVVIAVAVLVAGMGGSISGIWSSTNSVLQQANQGTGGGGSAPAPAGPN